MGVLAGTAAAVPGVWPVAVSAVRLRDLARVEKGSSTRLFCACFDPFTGLQSLPLDNMVFPLISETVRRPPRTCGPGAALGVMRIVKNVSTAVGTSFAARKLWQDDYHAQLQLLHTHVHFLHPRGASVSASTRSGRICKPPLRICVLDRGMVRICALPAHSAFAAS